MIKGFRHVCLLVKDLERSLRFYRDILRLRVDKIITLKGSHLEKIFKIKNAELIYTKMRSPDQPKKSQPIFELHCWRRPRRLPRKNYSHVSFSVKNLDQTYKKLKRKGVKFIASPAISPDGKTKICFGYDPEGNLIEFMEDLKKR
ncbi:MAG: hypothetical protein DRP74_03310 [Candidatus Omnitrophota bacterium]|nr:MAG: hypothetical protein DRP74_03310 [Candidatus Omnitrophota bacterium]